MAHDQRFKNLLQAFFREFLLLFFPERVAAFDWDTVAWLEKELFADPPQGDVLLLDLVARLRRRDADEVVTVLVHVEVESRDAVAPLRERMYHYYEHLRRKHQCPVLPIAVYLRVGLDGVGVDAYAEDYGDLDVLRFKFLYVGLPALDAERYVRGDNWLGVGLSALMKIPRARRAWLRSEALRRVLLECPENNYRKFLLGECIEAYLELDEEQQREFERLLQTEPYAGVPPMMTTTFEKGLQQGERRSIQLLLEQRFGTLRPEVRQRLDNWPAERLPELLLAIRDASSLKDLGLED